MNLVDEPLVETLVVDTTAFIQNVQLQTYGKNIVTVQEVVDEITNKRQLRRLVVLPYDLKVKHVDPESITAITEFAKKTGDYPSLSATDIKVMALAYQLEKEENGIEHLRSEPIVRRQVNVHYTKTEKPDFDVGLPGFYMPGNKNNWDLPSRTSSRTNSISTNFSDSVEHQNINEDLQNMDSVQEENENCDIIPKEDSENDIKHNEEELTNKFTALDCNDPNNVVNKEEEELMNEILCSQPNEDKVHEGDNVNVDHKNTEDEDSNEEDEDNEEDDDEGWITPSNFKTAKTIFQKQLGSKYLEEKHVKVACMTTDFAMQNVLKQINLNVAALDGRLITQLRTFILRCYTCFKTSSVMTKTFCPNCGNQTLKRVAVSLDGEGKQIIHINGKKPLTARGKKFSLPTPEGGKHANNPILCADQPVPDQRPSRMARSKVNILEGDFVQGYSPFAMRDTTSKSAMLGIRPKQEVKHWMRKNPNEARRKRK